MEYIIVDFSSETTRYMTFQKSQVWSRPKLLTSIIIWNWQLVPLLWFKQKSVRKGDEINTDHSWSFSKFKINIGKHWRIYFLLWIKPLLFKTQAICFYLLMSQVLLETFKHIFIQGDFHDAILNRHHDFHQVWCMTCYYWSPNSNIWQ